MVSGHLQALGVAVIGLYFGSVMEGKSGGVTFSLCLLCSTTALACPIISDSDVRIWCVHNFSLSSILYGRHLPFVFASHAEPVAIVHLGGFHESLEVPFA